MLLRVDYDLPTQLLCLLGEPGEEASLEEALAVIGNEDHIAPGEASADRLRAIRYTFAEKRLARAVFVNALLLVVMLALIQEAFGRAQLGLFHENISYGRLSFLGMVTVEALLISILAPLGAVNLFEAERRGFVDRQIRAPLAVSHTRRR